MVTKIIDMNTFYNKLLSCNKFTWTNSHESFKLKEDKSNKPTYESHIYDNTLCDEFFFSHCKRIQVLDKFCYLGTDNLKYWNK